MRLSFEVLLRLENSSRYCFLYVAVIAYRAYVDSRLSYGVIFWGNSVDIDRLLRVQKRCIRAIFGMKQTESCRQLFVRERIMTVISLYVYHSVLFMNENKAYFSDCVKTHKYDTRKKEDLVNERYKYTYLQRNVKYNIIKIYNLLPEDKRNIPSRNLKKWLKSILTQKPYYTLSEFFEDGDRFL